MPNFLHFIFDLHAKYRSTGRQVLDLGIVPMYACIEDTAFTDKCLHTFAKELGEVFAWINKSRRVPFEIETDPFLHGIWGHNTHTTLSH